MNVGKRYMKHMRRLFIEHLLALDLWQPVGHRLGGIQMSLTAVKWLHAAHMGFSPQTRPFPPHKGTQTQPGCPWVPSPVRYFAAVSGSSIRILTARSLFKQSSGNRSREARLPPINVWQVCKNRSTPYTSLLFFIPDTARRQTI